MELFGDSVCFNVCELLQVGEGNVMIVILKLTADTEVVKD